MVRMSRVDLLLIGPVLLECHTIFLVDDLVRKEVVSRSYRLNHIAHPILLFKGGHDRRNVAA